MLALEILLERAPGERFPALLAGERSDARAKGMQLEPVVDREVDAAHLLEAQAGRRGDFDEVEGGEEGLQVADAACERGGNPGGDELLGRAEGRIAIVGTEDVAGGRCERRRPGREVRARRGDVERTGAVAQNPAGRALEQDTRLEEHGELRRRRNSAVERLDLFPEAAEIEDV